MKWKGRRQSSNVAYQVDGRTFPSVSDMSTYASYRAEVVRNARPHPTVPNFRDTYERLKQVSKTAEKLHGFRKYYSQKKSQKRGNTPTKARPKYRTGGSF